MDRCKNCFWNSVTAESWHDFECRPGEDKATKIKQIKERKCKECKDGQDNYSEIWKCQKCGVEIDGHQYFWHGELCESCWMQKVDSVNK